MSRMILSLMLLGAMALPASATTNEGGSWKLPPCRVENEKSEKLTLADQLGEGHTLLLFWSTPCSSCLAKLKNVRNFAEEHAEEGLALVMINTDPPRNRTLVAPWMRRFGFGDSTYFDNNEETLRKLGGKKAPYLLLIDPDGNILFQSLLLRGKDLDRIEEILKARDVE